MCSLRDALDLIPADKRKYARQEAFYSLTWLPLTTGASNQPDTLTTQDDSDFVALRMKAYVTSTANPPAVNSEPQVTLTIQIGSNLIMPDATPIHLGTFDSSANDRAGHDFAFPLYVSRNTTMTGNATSLFNADLNVRLFFEGFRIMAYNNTLGG